MNEVNTAIEKLAEIFKSGKSIVFFGGAGTSTESGFPDFRSPGGLYDTDFHGRKPEYLLSNQCLMQEPELFYTYLRQKLHHPDALPNKGHIVLRRLEDRGIIKAVITQNIDGLHQTAGSKNVIELHGTMAKATCLQCQSAFSGLNLIQSAETVPTCPQCHGMLRPDVVLYGEYINHYVERAAENAMYEAEVLIIGGTSLAVYPAAQYVNYYEGNTIVLMNRDTTSIDHKASIIIREPIGESLAQAYRIAFGESI